MLYTGNQFRKHLEQEEKKKKKLLLRSLFSFPLSQNKHHIPVINISYVPGCSV